VGAPPGYVGYDEGGQLTEAVRRRPYQVILFDEIEKAHADVWNALMQILEEGRLTDGHGRIVDFRNTVIIMTSNIGTQFASRRGEVFGFRGSSQPTADERFTDDVSEGLKRTFRPEFLNRIDEIIIFHNLTRENVMQIVDLQMDEIRERLADQDIEVELTEGAKGWLAEMGFDEAFGARPLRRTIQRFVESPLSKRLLQGEFAPGETVVVSLDEAGDSLTFAKQSHEEEPDETSVQEPATAAEEEVIG
jgi:ATP-dependent Clp protease ATP-binding subunit ClpC